MLTCPGCNQAVTSRSRRCEHCGLNLALSATLAIHKLTSEVDITHDTPVTPEILIPRFGEQLVNMGVVREDDVDRALIYQKEQAAAGKSCLIGQALCELGSIDRETLDRAVTGIINQLQDELRQSNQKLEERVQERTADLQKALVKLGELDQLKTSFITMISHELRSPLAHITGFLDLLIGGHIGAVAEDQKDALEVIGQSTDHLGKLIDELLQFSYISNSEQEFFPRPVQLDEILERVQRRSQGKALEQGVELLVETNSDNSAGRSVVDADSDKLLYVLTQLVDNGIRFTPADGRVVIGYRCDGQQIICFVEDNGIGISPERQKEIFEPFHQLDGTLARKYGGMGLGLSIVKRIVEKHGSRVTVISEPRKGSRFEFSLPVHIDPR